MTAISIHLPEDLAKASQIVAHSLGLSRTEFIRQAIAHELQNLRTQQERAELVKSFAAMKENSEYLQELTDIEIGLDTLLPKEKNQWWKKKKKKS